MIGDRWQSDVLGALRAGLPAVLVDREGRSPARLLLDSPELFFATDGTVPPSTLPGLSRLIGTTPEALERAPEEHFEFEGAQPVRWRQADKVRIVGGLFEVSTALAGLGLA
jgi:hypothetical protein